MNHLVAAAAVAALIAMGSTSHGRSMTDPAVAPDWHESLNWQPLWPEANEDADLAQSTPAPPVVSPSPTPPVATPSGTPVPSPQPAPATQTPPVTPAPAVAPPPAPATPAPPPPPGTSPEGAPAAEPPPDGGAEGMPEGVDGGDDFSMGDLPVVETVELTADIARRALDGYVLVSEKYKDASLEEYENLQDFVDQAPEGKAFEADIKVAGFASVNDWNTAVTTISYAYNNMLDDQTTEIRQQIEEIKADTEMAQDMRDRMITALTAMIPSDNNKKIVEELSKDPAYAEKLKGLESEAEDE